MSQAQGRLLADPRPLACGADVRGHRHRRRDDGGAQLRRAGGRRRRRATPTASSPSTSRSRGGSSTIPARSGTRPRPRSASWSPGSTASRWPRSGSPTSGRRWWRGIDGPAQPLHTRHRLAGPPHRGPLRRAARGGASRPTCGPPPAWCSTPTSRPPRSSGFSPRAACPLAPTLALGTVDSWLVWNLTGGPDGGVHATEPSNASRTLLFDIGNLAWSPRARRALRGAGCGPARGPAVGRALRCHRRRAARPQRHPRVGDRRRPAGGAVRAGVPRARHDEEHLRHRELRAHERGRDVPRSGGGPAHHRRLDHGRTAPGPPTRWRGRSS